MAISSANIAVPKLISRRGIKNALVHTMRTRALGGTPANVSPPLLPAFLITGLLLAIIIAIIVWRHFVERRRLAQSNLEDPTWPEEGLLPQPVPTLWEVEVHPKVEEKESGCTWEKTMPISIAPLRAQPKTRQPRYLIPSDRPTSFWTRMFGTERLEFRRRPSPQPLQGRQPNTSTMAPTNSVTQKISTVCDDEEHVPFDKLQVTVLIALPRRRRCLGKQQEISPEMENHKVNERRPGITSGSGKETLQGNERDSIHETEEPEYDVYSSDESDSLQISLGTITLPYNGDI